jgi:hypothetical protein
MPVGASTQGPRSTADPDNDGREVERGFGHCLIASRRPRSWSMASAAPETSTTAVRVRSWRLMAAQASRPGCCSPSARPSWPGGGVSSSRCGPSRRIPRLRRWRARSSGRRPGEHRAAGAWWVLQIRVQLGRRRQRQARPSRAPAALRRWRRRDERFAGWLRNKVRGGAGTAMPVASRATSAEATRHDDAPRRRHRATTRGRPSSPRSLIPR